MITNSAVIYDQPVNEHMRVCLRLEYLFDQVLHYLQGANQWDSHAALTALLEILNLLDRPDLKSKLVKELSRYAALLTRFGETPHIDRAKLSAVLHELEHIIRSMHAVQGRLGQVLRDNEFLMSVRSHLVNPGGACSFDVPAYYHWLHQPISERVAQLSTWLAGLRVVQSAVDLMLRLIRQSSSPKLHIAESGFYQAALDASLSCQLVRVAIPQTAEVYPEISVGRHGISIRFYTFNLAQRPVQTAEDVRFQLTSCVF